MKNCFHVIVLDSFSIGITLKQNNEHESSLINYKFFGFFFLDAKYKRLEQIPVEKGILLLVWVLWKWPRKG